MGLSRSGSAGQHAALQSNRVGCRPRPDRSLSNLQGPQLHLRVVGITRDLFTVGASSSTKFFDILTPAFFRKYGSALQFEPMAMVRYRSGVTDAQFDAAVARVLPRTAISDSGTFTSTVDALRSSAGVLANGLLVFALVALVLLSQVLARYEDRGEDERRLLRVFGASRRARIVDACLPIVPVALAGAAPPCSVRGSHHAGCRSGRLAAPRPCAASTSTRRCSSAARSSLRCSSSSSPVLPRRSGRGGHPPIRCRPDRGPRARRRRGGSSSAESRLQPRRAWSPAPEEADARSRCVPR